MKLKRILIVLLLGLCLIFSNVNAAEDTVYGYDQSVGETTEDSDYLPPVDPSGYKVSPVTSTEGGGTFYPHEIWIFRIAIILIIGSIGIFIYKKVKAKKGTVEEDNGFYIEN